MRIYLTLETLEYLKKGGRISGAQAAIGTLLSVKPIIRVQDGIVDTIDKVRTRAKARERMIELITERPIERLAILHTISPDVEAFRDEVLARAPELARERRDHRYRRRVGRAAPRSGLRRRGDPVPGLTARAVGPCGPVPGRIVATRLRHRCHPVPSGRREAARPGYTRAADESRAGVPVRSFGTRRRAPWGRPGDDPNRRRSGDRPHVRTSVP